MSLLFSICLWFDLDMIDLFLLEDGPLRGGACCYRVEPVATGWSLSLRGEACLFLGWLKLYIALETNSLPAIFRLSWKDCCRDLPLAIFTPVLGAIVQESILLFSGLGEPFSWLWTIYCLCHAPVDTLLLKKNWYWSTGLFINHVYWESASASWRGRSFILI